MHIVNDTAQWQQIVNTYYLKEVQEGLLLVRQLICIQEVHEEATEFRCYLRECRQHHFDVIQRRAGVDAEKGLKKPS
jgi:hypothetical protein